MAQSPSESKPLNFLAFVSDDESVSVLREFAETKGLEPQIIHQGDVNNAIEHLASAPTPDYLIVDIATAEDAPDALDRLADVCDPNVKVIVTSTVDEYSFFRWLTEIGVHFYLLKPLGSENLEAAFTAQPATAAAEAGARRGKLVAVIGARGGVGASTVALSMSAILGTVHKVDTALLDLEPQWGTASMMLDLEPGRGLREALSKPDRIDGLFLDRVMLKYHEHLAILSSEEPFDTLIDIHPDAAETLLGEALQKYAMVIADLPREISPFTQTVLKEADHVVVISELTLLGLRDAMRLQDLLTTHLKVKKLHMVANRTGLVGKFEMPKADFEKSVGSKLAATIPFDLEAYGKLAGGDLPPLAKANTAFSEALHNLVGLVHKARGKPAKTPDKPKPALVKWLKGGAAS